MPVRRACRALQPAGVHGAAAGAATHLLVRRKLGLRRGGAREATAVGRAHPGQVGAVDVPGAACGARQGRGRGRGAAQPRQASSPGALPLAACPSACAPETAMPLAALVLLRSPTCVGRLPEGDVDARLQGHLGGKELDVVHLRQRAQHGSQREWAPPPPAAGRAAAATRRTTALSRPLPNAGWRACRMTSAAYRVQEGVHGILLAVKGQRHVEVGKVVEEPSHLQGMGWVGE